MYFNFNVKQARIPFNVQQSSKSNQQLMSIQQQQVAQNQAFLNQKSFISSLSSNTKNNLTSSGSSVTDMYQSTNNNFNSNNNNNNKLSSLALAIQHQEEIYSLIDQKAIKNFNIATTTGQLTRRSSAKPSKLMQNEITTILYKKTNKLHHSRSKLVRPKTSKT